MPGTSASVSSAICVIANPSPTFSSLTSAVVRMRVGVMPARDSCAVTAIVKQPAWAAPMSSSGLVADWPSSNRDLNEYGPSKAPLPSFSLPPPSARLPFHSASALRVGLGRSSLWLPLVPRAPYLISAGRLTGVIRRELGDRRPVECVATVREQCQEPIAQQAPQRHGHAQGFRRSEGEANVLLSQRCGEARRLELSLGDQRPVGLVHGRGEERGRQHIEIAAAIDARLADERHGLAQRLDRRGDQEITAELDQVRSAGFVADDERLLPDRLE